MQNNTSLKQQVKQLIDISGAGESGYVVNHTSFAIIDLVNRGFVKSIAFEGPLMQNQELDSLCNHDAYEITEAGQTWLNQGAPMVDQPQPSSEVEPQPFKVGDLVNYVDIKNQQQIGTVTKVGDVTLIVLTSAGRKIIRHTDEVTLVNQPQLPADVQTIDGEVSFMAPDGKIYDGTIKAGADRYGYTIRAVDGKVYDEIKRSDIEPRLADEIDDLPFSDIGKEDTQELPIVVDTPELSLSNLVDAALDPDNTEAFERLKVYDLTNVPLWILEIERNDVADYKWDICRELNTMKFGNTEYGQQLKEVERAFQVDDILTKAMKPQQAVR